MSKRRWNDLEMQSRIRQLQGLEVHIPTQNYAFSLAVGALSDALSELKDERARNAMFDIGEKRPHFDRYGDQRPETD